MMKHNKFSQKKLIIMTFIVRKQLSKEPIFSQNRFKKIKVRIIFSEYISKNKLIKSEQ
jgi:hypothetical protein